MMILVYLIFIGLLSRTSGQMPVVSLSKPYVNKSETVTITCTVAVITDSVLISKDGINLIRCPSPPITCATLDHVATAYVAVQNVMAGTTAVTIGASSILRDTGNWTCLYGAASRSTPISLSVVTPSSSSRLIEEPGYIILELNCTYPNMSLDLTFYLGANKYTEGSLEESSVPCDDYEASLNYTLKFPSQHSNSYDGIFNVFYNNGFYVARISGSRHYTFSTTTTTTTTSTTEETGTTIIFGIRASFVFILLMIVTMIIIICLCCYLYHNWNEERKQTDRSKLEKSNTQPPEIHTASKQTNTSVLRRALHNLGGGLDDKPIPLPELPPPENSDVNDQILQGLIANFDETQGLTRKEENYSEEPKKEK